MSTNAPETPRLLSMTEAAAALGISRAGVYRAIDRGDLAAVSLGGRRLVPASEIDRLVTDLMGAGRP